MKNERISKKSIKEWLIVRTILFLITLGVAIGIIFAIENSIAKTSLLTREIVGIRLAYISFFAIILGFLATYAFIFPKMQYDRWFYSIENNLIELSNGVVFKHDKKVPFVRLQHIEVFRGILDRIFGLSSVLIFTAGGAVRIPNLEKEQAVKVVNFLKVCISELKVEEAND